MKLLFDQNISFRIINRIMSYFPESKHVKDCGLENSTDASIWDFARMNDYIIVTFDADFYDMSILLGAPPKIIWLRIGNTSTLNIANVLINNHEKINEFGTIESGRVCFQIF